ncbi:hypothetical protein B0H12DRAFT_571692 [Mycena haematopus]|nr:hypothetical protein B0H12DRAFT_571692 [Mycena haematopus]
MDFVQNLDPSKLTLGLTALSFIISPFSSPAYNLPIMLFGVVAAQLQESADGQALQLFTGLLGGSAIFDIIWMTQNEQSGFIRLLTIVLQIGKIPTFIAFALALRQRGGGQFAGLGIRGGDLSGATACLEASAGEETMVTKI